MGVNFRNMTAGWILYLGLILYHIVCGLLFFEKLSHVVKESNDLKKDFKKVFTFYIVCPLILLATPFLLSWINGFKFSVLDFYYPTKLGFEIFVFQFFILFSLLFSGFWIYFRNGAEILSKYPSIVNIKFGIKRYSWLYISKIDIQAYYGILILAYVVYIASIFMKYVIK